MRGSHTLVTCLHRYAMIHSYLRKGGWLLPFSSRAPPRLLLLLLPAAALLLTAPSSSVPLLSPLDKSAIPMLDLFVLVCRCRLASLAAALEVLLRSGFREPVMVLLSCWWRHLPLCLLQYSSYEVDAPSVPSSTAELEEEVSKEWCPVSTSCRTIICSRPWKAQYGWYAARQSL